MFNNYFSCLREFAVSTALCRQIDNDRSWRHARDHFPKQLTLAPVEILILRLRVSSCVLRVLRFDGQLEESAAQALNLLLGGRPQIVRGDHGSEPARRGDRLKSSDASADDENARGRNGSRRSRKHGKNLR